MRGRRNPPPGVQLRDCDSCGWTYLLRELTKQRGYLVCPRCKDEPRRVHGGRVLRGS